jgi:hypothetical protein
MGILASIRRQKPNSGCVRPTKASSKRLPKWSPIHETMHQKPCDLLETGAIDVLSPPGRTDSLEILEYSNQKGNLE